MKLEPATLTWKDFNHMIKWTRHLHRLIPVLLRGSEAFGAKIGDTVDEVVETSKVSSNLRHNLEAVGSH